MSDQDQRLAALIAKHAGVIVRTLRPIDEESWPVNVMFVQKVLERFIADELEAAASALRAVRSETPEWQPIDTVPTGTMVLVCSMRATEAQNWCFVDWFVGGKPIAHPRHSATHWMPLPQHPRAGDASASVPEEKS